MVVENARTWAGANAARRAEGRAGRVEVEATAAGEAVAAGEEAVVRRERAVRRGTAVRDVEAILELRRSMAEVERELVGI